MAIVAVSISPIGEAVSVSKFVGAALDVVQAQERITTLEGDMSEVYALISDMQEAVFAAGATRVSTVIKIDDRRDRVVSMEDKVKSALDKTQNKTVNR